MADSTSTLQSVMAVLVGLLMLGLGSTVSIEKARRAVVSYAPLIGLCCQTFVEPFLGYILCIIFGFNNLTSLSVVAIGCTPGGSTSNLFSYFSKGDVSLSITMTIVSNLLSFGTLPLLLFLWAEPFTDSTVQIPYTNVLLGLMLVLVPVSIGVTIRTYQKWLARYLEIGATVLGVIFIVVAIIYGSVTEASIFQSPAGEWVTAFIMVLGGAAMGYFLSLVAGLRKYQARTVALETGIQNSTLTLAIISFTFSDVHQLSAAVRFPLLYSFILILCGIVMSVIFHYLAQFDSEEDVAHRLMAGQKDEEVTAVEDATHAGSAVAAAAVTGKVGDDSDIEALKPATSIQMVGGESPIVKSRPGAAV